ncbi:N6-adenosine-methyltransferase TMT1A-like [Phymastichus coffea]|uniref:N6-adenosine-methyltransferase TMT1A-like n=1 Tax=Phymastichus coffea TaxID=108790 RepID=UPI00273CB05A|nr:N6-adenosine-methyltransferase TMT1A-like [Phymastichus coffea]
MSSGDLWMRDLITTYGLALLVSACALIVFSWSWSRFRQNHFKSFLLGFECECAQLASAHKKRLFSVLRQTVSHDELLRSLNRIRILEIGVKTGDNIQYYPEGTHFIGVDWNRKLGEYLVNGDRSWQFAHVIFERLIIGDGSCMRAVPTGCVDVVVTTRSLCSTDSITDTLREIHRVLAPGGTYLFMEHLPDKPGSFVAWIQMMLTKTKIWPSLFGACRLDFDPIEHLERSRLKNLSWQRIVLQGYVSQPHHLLLSRHHIIGSASR